MDEVIEYFNFTTWRLLQSSKDDFTRYNTGYLDDKTIGYFHEIGMNTNSRFLYFAKPVYTFAQFSDNVTVIKGFAIHEKNFKEDVVILNTITICNN